MSNDPDVWYLDLAMGNVRVRFDHGVVTVSPPDTPTKLIEHELRDLIAFHGRKAARGAVCLRTYMRQRRKAARSPKPQRPQ